MKLYQIAGLVLLLGSCFQPGDEHTTLPQLNLMLIDSATIFNTRQIPEGRPIVLVYFSPDCEHCQAETAGILGKMDRLKGVQFYFVTTDPFEKLRVFRDYYQLSKYPNIVLTKDYAYSFTNFFKPTTTPYVLIYDRKKQLKAIYNGEARVSNIISFTQNL